MLALALVVLLVGAQRISELSTHNARGFAVPQRDGGGGAAAAAAADAFRLSSAAPRQHQRQRQRQRVTFQCGYDWGPWSPCSVTCGIGRRSRAATLHRGSDAECEGRVAHEACWRAPCPNVDCAVGSWGSASAPSSSSSSASGLGGLGGWSPCSRACGGGLQKRSRPVLRSNSGHGKACPSLEEDRPCNRLPCPTVDCRVGDWGGWSACSASCGGGVVVRVRRVLRRPSSLGQRCPPTGQSRACGASKCPLDCVLWPWTPWAPCRKHYAESGFCYTGTQSRARAVRLEASGNGRPCPPPSSPLRLKTRGCEVTFDSGRHRRGRGQGRGQGQGQGQGHGSANASLGSSASAHAARGGIGLLPCSGAGGAGGAGGSGFGRLCGGVAPSEARLDAASGGARGSKAGKSRGATIGGWRRFGTNGLYVDVDARRCGFGSTGAQVALSMSGARSNVAFELVQATLRVVGGARAGGGHTPGTFRAVAYFPLLRGSKLLLAARTYRWRLNWLSDNGRFSGATATGATGWRKHATDPHVIFVDVNTTACGFRGDRPRFFPSLRAASGAVAGAGAGAGAQAEHSPRRHAVWRATGAGVAVRPRRSGFRVYVRTQRQMPPAHAEALQWVVTWVGVDSFDYRAYVAAGGEWEDLETPPGAAARAAAARKNALSVSSIFGDGGAPAAAASASASASASPTPSPAPPAVTNIISRIALTSAEISKLRVQHASSLAPASGSPPLLPLPPPPPNPPTLGGVAGPVHMHLRRRRRLLAEGGGESMLPAAPPLELAQMLSGTAWVQGTTALHSSGSGSGGGSGGGGGGGGGGARSHKVVKGEGDAHWAVDRTLLGHALTAKVEPKLPRAVAAGAGAHGLSYVVAVSVDVEKLDGFSGSFDRLQQLLGSVTLTGLGSEDKGRDREGFDLYFGRCGTLLRPPSTATVMGLARSGAWAVNYVAVSDGLHPTDAPTPSPTPAPTAQPTPAPPTPAPTHHPSAAPTPRPTPQHKFAVRTTAQIANEDRDTFTMRKEDAFRRALAAALQLPSGEAAVRVLGVQPVVLNANSGGGGGGGGDGGGLRRRLMGSADIAPPAGVMPMPFAHKGWQPDVALSGQRGDAIPPSGAIGMLGDRPPLDAVAFRTGAAPAAAPAAPALPALTPGPSSTGTGTGTGTGTAAARRTAHSGNRPAVNIGGRASEAAPAPAASAGTMRATMRALNLRVSILMHTRAEATRVAAALRSPAFTYKLARALHALTLRFVNTGASGLPLYGKGAVLRELFDPIVSFSPPKIEQLKSLGGRRQRKVLSQRPRTNSAGGGRSEPAAAGRGAADWRDALVQLWPVVGTLGLSVGILVLLHRRGRRDAEALSHATGAGVDPAERAAVTRARDAGGRGGEQMPLHNGIAYAHEMTEQVHIAPVPPLSDLEAL